MPKINPRNERIKREYFEFLRQADQKAETTVRSIERALIRFEEHTGFADFASFNRSQAIDFRASVAKTGVGSKSLRKATVLTTLKVIQRFLRWLSLQPSMRSHIREVDIAYLNMSEKDVRAAGASPTRAFPTLEQLKHVLSTIPATNQIEKRDRAVFALLMLTGIRDNAAASLRLRHVDLQRQVIIQDPKTVRTKNSKLIESVLLPLGEEVEWAFTEWIGLLKDQLGYGPDDPVFPQTRTRIDTELGPVADGLKPEVWSSAAPIRELFRRAFRRAGLPHFSPHRVRHSIVEYAYRSCRTPEEFKAFSQNLGHASITTTLASYGTIPLSRQRELIRSASQNRDETEKLDRILALIEGGRA